jgi:methyl-accepting chemotaxis protein
MKIKINIKNKMLLFILGVTAAIYTFSLYYIATSLGEVTSTSAQNFTQFHSKKIEKSVESYLSYPTSSLLAAARLVEKAQQLPGKGQSQYLQSILDNVIQGNASIENVWMIVDSEFFPDQQDTVAMKSRMWVKGNIDKTRDLLELEDLNMLRVSFAENKKVLFRTPQKADSNLFSVIVTPLFSKGAFIGAIGVILSLDELFQSIQEIPEFKSALIDIVDKQYLVHSTRSKNKFSIDGVFSDNEDLHIVQSNIDQGTPIEIKAVDQRANHKAIIAIQPIIVSNQYTYWNLMVSAKYSEVFSSLLAGYKKVLLIGVLGLLFMSLVIIFIANIISKPIAKTNLALKKLADGNIRAENKVNFQRSDKIGEMASSTNTLFDNLMDAIEFAKETGKGNLNTEYKLRSNSDALGKALINMQESLLLAQKEELAKKEEEDKRNWITHGLAKFGDLFRQDTDNIQRFSENIVHSLVDYMNIAQAALYIREHDEYTNQNTDDFTLMAVMAYGKQVMMQKTIEKGKELVGRVVDENKTLVLKDIPEHYVNLSPGMKNRERPRNLLITPLPINEETYGVFELLSYSSFDDYQIEFLERLSENIASVILSVKTNIRTAKLLKQSQVQADELAQHEEEMRQNLEEMQATQEEAAKRQTALNSYISAIKSTVMYAELSTEGRIVDVSPSLAAAYGGTLENMRDKFLDAFVAKNEQTQKEYRHFWEGLLDCGSGKRVQQIEHRNKTNYYVESYQVVEVGQGRLKVFLMAEDKTKQKELEEMAD